MATGGAPQPTFKDNVRVALNISCDNLLDIGLFSKSDPVVVLWMNTSGRDWFEVGRTEVIQNCLNPRFSKRVVLKYHFERIQKLRFDVLDIDTKNCSLEKADFLGQLECTLGQIMSCSKFTMPLVRKDKRSARAGTITICAERQTDNRMVEFDVAARKLDKKKFGGILNPFLEFHKDTVTGWQLAYRTEVVKNNSNPEWKPFRISMQSLCEGDMKTIIKVECYDNNNSGSHYFIGSFQVTLGQIQQATQSNAAEFELINSEKMKKGYKNSGVVIIKGCKMVEEKTFEDYKMAGCQMKFTIAVDFTESNGDIRSPLSLHFNNPRGINEYLSAILSVSHVTKNYDSDQMFRFFGFGAEIPSTGQVSHMFPINFSSTNPVCAGVDEMISAYRQCLPQLKLHGPTNFAPIINHVADFARQAWQQQTASEYHVLFILTDGVVCDVDQTRDAIVHASRLPMSIVIVGLGFVDISDLEFLKGKKGPLRSTTGEAAMRDIVHLVPYTPFQVCSREALAQGFMAEVEGQVATFFNMESEASCRQHSDSPLSDLLPSAPPGDAI